VRWRCSCASLSYHVSSLGSVSKYKVNTVRDMAREVGHGSRYELKELVMSPLTSCIPIGSPIRAYWRRFV
jgi:hypothetical protein